ncbi:hypothetical protein PI87_02885 [Ralstonia sp. A12]|nr:hypothetical protein PI87_02885 [Ralstonia sp. A12]
MLPCEDARPVEPTKNALLRLTELAAAIDTAAGLLTPSAAEAIRHELGTIARALKRLDHMQRSRQIASAPITAAPMQGDLLG